MAAKRTCSIEGCEKPVHGKGWCSTHLKRWKIHGDPLEGARVTWAGICCSVDGCSSKVEARGWCSIHYQRWRHHGNPLIAQVQLPWPDNLLRRMDPQPNGCIWFIGYVNGEGYGRVWNGKADLLAHRAAFEHFVGPIPEGLTIDHECHNRDASCPGGVTCPHRRCVNVEHLTVKTRGENSSASPTSTAAQRRARTHCKRGHPYDEANTRLDAKGYRICRACCALRERDRRRQS